MSIISKKLEIMELLLKTENEVILSKIKSIFTIAPGRATVLPGKRNKRGRKSVNEIKNGINHTGFTFNWEGGLKELENKFDGVKLQHHINSLRK